MTRRQLGRLEAMEQARRLQAWEEDEGHVEAGRRLERACGVISAVGLLGFTGFCGWTVGKIVGWW